MPKVSIIIPVYNVQDYIGRCLDSILAQTFKDFEVIVVNDGSKDNSGKIVSNYTKKYNFIKLIDKENEGVSVARNLGLKSAQGDFITFIDSDDWIEKNALEVMVENIEKFNADIIILPIIKRVYDNGKVVIENENVISEELLLYENVKTVDLIKEVLCGYWGTAPWGRLYKRKIISDYRIEFLPLSIVFSEDGLFNLMYSYHTKRICVMNKSIYYYYYRTNSLTNIKTDVFDVLYRFLEFKRISNQYMGGLIEEVSHAERFIYGCLIRFMRNNLKIKNIKKLSSNSEFKGIIFKLSAYNEFYNSLDFWGKIEFNGYKNENNFLIYIINLLYCIKHKFNK